MITNNSEVSPSAQSSGSQYHQYDCMTLACGESGSLNIISELNSLYEERVMKIESRTGHSTNDPLVHTLKSWVTDINVQNAELVHALEDLEQETACRVKLIEEKLKGTSIATRDYMAKAQDYNNQLQSVRNGSGTAGEDTALIDHLKSDTRNLCRLLQQGRESDNWNTDDYIFFEITLEEIFGTNPVKTKLTKPNETTSDSQANNSPEEDCDCDNLRLQLEEKKKTLDALQDEFKKLNEEILCKDAQLKKMGLELSEFNRTQENIDGELTDRNSVIGSLENDLQTMKEHMALKDEQIVSLIQKIQELRDDLQEKSCTVNSLMQNTTEVTQSHSVKQRKIDDQQNEILILSRHLQETEYRLDYVVGDKQQLTDNLHSVHRELLIKKKEVEALTNVITDMDKCAKDKQAALTGEIADKHDEISQLKRECLQLEDRCRQADVQIIFKDGIIKEMRKEVKLAKLNFMSYGETRPKSISQIPESSSLDGFAQNVATDEMKEEMNRLITILKGRDEKIAIQEILIEELKKDLASRQESLSRSSLSNGLHGEKMPPVFNPAICDPSRSTVLTEIPHGHTDFSQGDMGIAQSEDSNNCYVGLESSMLQVKEMNWMLEEREEEICHKNAMIVRLRSLLRLAHFGLLKVSGASPSIYNFASKSKSPCKSGCPKRVCKEDTKPPKILRAASIEEFRVKTVEAQAAIEDMMEEMETLLSNLNEREKKFNELERIIETLQLTLNKNRQEMNELETGTSQCDQQKQVPIVSLEGKAMQILQLKESLRESFANLSASPHQARADHYQKAANEFQLAMDKVTCELMEIMHAVLSSEKQVVFKQDVIRDVKESLAQIQTNMGQVQEELVSYLKVKEKTEESRKESERKMEKWQTELENAQDELRDNVEQYAATEYASRRLVETANKERPPSRSPLIRNHVYRGSDNEVRRTIEEFKEQIDILVDELEEFDDYKEANEQKVKELQENLECVQSKVDSLQPTAINGSCADQDCNCAEEDDPASQGNPTELLQDALEMTNYELEQIQQDIENLLSGDLFGEKNPAKDLVALIGEHTAIVDELNSRSKNLQEALDKARAQIRTMSEKNEKNSSNQLPSSKEQQIVLDEYCKKTLQLEEELERSRAQVQSIKGDLKSNVAQCIFPVLEKKEQRCQCSEKSQTNSRRPPNDQFSEGDICSCQPLQPGESSTNVLVEELEKQVAHQQVTIGNLQKALLVTKHQLEDLQGRGSFEVLRQENVIEKLRDENLDLEVENVNLFLDVAQMEDIFNQKSRLLRLKEESLSGLKNIVEKLRTDLDHMMMENGSLYEELQQKDEILRKMAKVNHERTILQRELQDELSNTTTLVKMQQHMQIIHQSTRNFKMNVTKKVKAICMKTHTSPKGVCQYKSRSQAGSEDESVGQLEQQIVDLESQLIDEERLNDENAEKLGELQLTVDSQALEIKNWKLSFNKLQKSYDKAHHCAQEKEEAIKLLTQEICQLQSSSQACQCSSLGKKLELREQQVESLQQEVDTLKRKSNSCKCTVLESQLHQRDVELEGLANQVSELRGKVSECNCRSMSCQLKRKEAELNRQRREMAELRQRLAACRCASRCKAVVEQERIIQTMQGCLSNMESMIQQKDDELKAAQNQFYEEKSEMERQLCELTYAAKDMQSNCNCEKNQAALVEAVEREASLQATFTKQDKQLRAKIQEMHMVELQLSDEVQALNAQVLNLENDLSQAGRMRAENKVMHAELEDGRKEYAKLHEALFKANSFLIEAKNHLERKAGEVDHLRSLLSSSQGEKGDCTNDKLITMVQEMTNLKCEITRLVHLREKTNAEVREYLAVAEKWWWDDYSQMCKNKWINISESNKKVAALQEAYQYLNYEFNSKSQSVVKLRSILSKVTFSDSQSKMVLCAMQRGDCPPQVQDTVVQKELNPQNEIKKLYKTKELMTKVINKLIGDNTNLRRKLRARTLSQNNDWPLLTYPCKVLDTKKKEETSTSVSSSQSSNKEESDAPTSSEGTWQQDEEISKLSSNDSRDYAESSDISSSH